MSFEQLSDSDIALRNRSIVSLPVEALLGTLGTAGLALDLARGKISKRTLLEAGMLGSDLFGIAMSTRDLKKANEQIPVTAGDLGYAGQVLGAVAPAAAGVPLGLFGIKKIAPGLRGVANSPMLPGPIPWRAKAVGAAMALAGAATVPAGIALIGVGRNLAAKKQEEFDTMAQNRYSAMLSR